MTGKSDIGQSRADMRFTAERLAERGLPGDLEALRAMGHELEGSEGEGWRLKA